VLRAGDFRHGGAALRRHGGVGYERRSKSSGSVLSDTRSVSVDIVGAD
jgi:hypothetical protein